MRQRSKSRLFVSGKVNRKRLDVKTLLVAATHRSGSYLACDMLSSVGGLPFPEEHFNFDLKTAREELRLSESVPKNKVLKALMDCRYETYGIFTVKAMWPAFSTLFSALEETQEGSNSFETTALQWLKSPLILFIRRRDKFRQAVSFEIAKQSGIWRKRGGEKTHKSDLLYSYPRILDCWDQIHGDEACWLYFFKAYDLAYHEIWYEDLVAEPIKEIKIALGHIGVETQREILPKNRFVKQSDVRNREWTDRFKARQSLDVQEVVASRMEKPLKGQNKDSNSAASNSISVSINPKISKIEMKPDSTKLILVELANKGTVRLDPVLNAYGLSDYFLELRYSENPKGEFLWQAELEEVVLPGESTELSLRLRSDARLESFDCDILFTHPQGELAIPNALSVDIQVDEKWEVLHRIFSRIDLSDKPGWIYIKDFGDMWIEKFPFVYIHEHGWLFVHKESASAGIFCAIDFKLNYFAVHLNRPREFHIFPDGTTSAKHVEFLGVEMGMRRFRDLKSGEINTYSLSYKSDLGDPILPLKDSN